MVIKLDCVLILKMGSFFQYIFFCVNQRSYRWREMRYHSRKHVTLKGVIQNRNVAVMGALQYIKYVNNVVIHF